jgi:hypothetical protein
VHCKYNAVNRDRVKIGKFPLGYSLEKSQELFRDFCADWFDWDKSLSFEAAIQGNFLSKAKHQYAILPFYLNKRDWKPCFAAYFDWIAAQLAARPTGGPKLLVFLVLYLDDLHNSYDETTQMVSEPKSADIINTVNAICEKHPNAGHFYPLHPVHETDVRDWFTDLGEMNNARIQPVLDALAQGLPEEEKELFRQSKLLNMDRVELVQELVFDLYNK